MLLTFFPGFPVVLIIEEIFQGVKKMEVSISTMVSETVDRIEALISDVAELQRAYVERVCSNCEAPCCTRVHYLFNEKDILYLRLFLLTCSAKAYCNGLVRTDNVIPIQSLHFYRISALAVEGVPK